MNNALEITEKKVMNILAWWVFWGWKWGLRSHVLKSACNDLGMLLWKRCLLNLALKVEGKKVDICIWITDSLCFIQFSSVTQSYSTLCNLLDCSMPGLPVHYQLLELSQTHVPLESAMPSNHLILWSPLLLLPSIFPNIRVSSNESVLRIRWPKYWSFSFSISPSNEHSGLISFRIDWFDLHAVQGTLKSLLQHHISKASVFQCSAFFMVQLSYPNMTTGKTIALTRWTFVGKVISLLFNMLSRLVIAFLPRSKHLLISWLQSPTAVIL